MKEITFKLEEDANTVLILSTDCNLL